MVIAAHVFALGTEERIALPPQKRAAQRAIDGAPGEVGRIELVLAYPHPADEADSVFPFIRRVVAGESARIAMISGELMFKVISAARTVFADERRGDHVEIVRADPPAERAPVLGSPIRDERPRVVAHVSAELTDPVRAEMVRRDVMIADSAVTARVMRRDDARVPQTSAITGAPRALRQRRQCRKAQVFDRGNFHKSQNRENTPIFCCKSVDKPRSVC